MEEKKRKSQPYAERKFDKAKKQNYDTNYRNNNLDRIEFLAPKGYKEELKTIATSKGISVAELIRVSVDNYINNK